jgi:hypothetical protein
MFLFSHLLTFVFSYFLIFLFSYFLISRFVYVLSFLFSYVLMFLFSYFLILLFCYLPLSSCHISIFQISYLYICIWAKIQHSWTVRIPSWRWFIEQKVAWIDPGIFGAVWVLVGHARLAVAWMELAWREEKTQLSECKPFNSKLHFWWLSSTAFDSPHCPL